MTRVHCRSLLPAVTVAALALVLGACGGGGGGGGFSTSSSSGGSGSSGGPPTEAQRISAASTTAASNAGCNAIEPFYWEIGDATERLAGATEPSSATAPTVDTVMPLLSASKWLFSSFVVQYRASQLSQDDVQALTMTSGYVNMVNDSCDPSQTVADCASAATNGAQDTSQIGVFHYNSGHFQHLGANGNLGIAADLHDFLKGHMDAYLGSDLTYTWDTVELAGGVSDSAADYAAFLRKILSGTLLMGAELGTRAVPASSAACTGGATACIPGPPFANENLHYSLGHWVEDDPGSLGDGAFSSPGYFGFYPWIDSSKTWYGIIARDVDTGDASAFTGSITCGRLIRHAWLTGVAQ
jgi:hypothetical protein